MSETINECHLLNASISDLVAYEKATQTLLKWYKDFIEGFGGKTPKGSNQEKFEEAQKKYRHTYCVYLLIIKEIEKRVNNLFNNCPDSYGETFE